jgi:site-specific DNA recombinase
MTRAVLYSRVSTEEQGDNFSLASQEQACRAYAEQHGFFIVGSVQDLMSGAILDRPGLARVRHLVQTRAVEVVVVYSPDRLTRSVAHSMLLRDEMRTAGVALHTVARGASQDAPEGGLMDTIEAAFAEYERLKIGERMLRGQRQRVVAGLSHGNKLPFGYRYADETRTRIVVNEDEAAIVRMIFDWYLNEAIGTLQIANRLTDLRIPSPADRQSYFAAPKRRGQGEWSQSSVIKIISQTAYKGELKCRVGGEVFVTSVPPIIHPNAWHHAECLREERFKLSRRNARQLYILRTHVTCGRCGSSCVGSHGGRKFHYYRCIGITKPRVDATKCNLPQFRDSFLEELVWSWLCEAVLNEERIREAIASLEDESEGERTRAESERAVIAQQLKQLEAQAGKLLEVYTAGIFTLEEIAAQKAHLDQARNSCLKALAELDARIAGMATAYQRADELCELVRAVQVDMADLSKEDRYRVVNLLDLRVTLNYEGEAGRNKRPALYADVVCNLTVDRIRIWVQGVSNETTTVCARG